MYIFFVFRIGWRVQRSVQSLKTFGMHENIFQVGLPVGGVIDPRSLC
jgi:hypothetical protein